MEHWWLQTKGRIQEATLFSLLNLPLASEGSSWHGWNACWPWSKRYLTPKTQTIITGQLLKPLSPHHHDQPCQQPQTRHISCHNDNNSAITISRWESASQVKRLCDTRPTTPPSYICKHLIGLFQSCSTLTNLVTSIIWLILYTRYPQDNQQKSPTWLRKRS